MSVLIKGMEMPTRCFSCPMCDVENAEVNCAISHGSYIEYKEVDPKVAIQERPSWCPLIEAPEWISVTEKLPEETGHYLAYFVAGNFKQVAWIEIVYFWNRFAWEHKFGDEYREQITHWMPLPEPPNFD